ncbi:uncharacterized membrane protein YcaP (DUF421 family) [Paenibacillus rhizosphaerae]|uniref:Uncharacterized membrane protein YcaP (DUF421 family) n=1 Tax=Paenibacillus rhizosphaerae TaxID=297318 RepID=A0A839TN55_9BACL|nr:YetF domain-containing protein [Paenibacillus rhizosphaerae]MBB3126207.1 uncharacterized membrane protein YcaP (DUF421 family) [Paenibacillus rhizosphaerae]
MIIVWQSAVVALAGILLLRISGRKSISQMTVPQVTILLIVGTVLGSQVSGKGLGWTLLASAVMIVVLMLNEWLAVKWNRAEKVLKGGAVPVIENGKMLTSNMKRLRLTVDDLEKRLRLLGISRIEDVRTGTVENNGELGYELMPWAKPVTMGELEKILKANFPQMHVPESPEERNIFREVIDNADQPMTQDRLH